MARTKQATLVKRQPATESLGRLDQSQSINSNPKNKRPPPPAAARPKVKQAGLVELLVCVLGIYASFISWAILQERITTTPYQTGVTGSSTAGAPTTPGGTSSKAEYFRYSIFLNTIQSTFAAVIGYVYLFVTTFNTSGLPPLVPTWNALPSLLLVAVTSSLASPFGYASLRHIDYITFILAKSCKLLPVMALHLTVFRKRYPLYKYAVVAMVTAGVAIFTLHHPSTISKRSSSSSKTKDNEGDAQVRNNAWGLFLLSINLLFDGLTNSTQDYIFSTFQPFSGPQMMCILNLLNTVLTLSYLVGAPYLSQLTVFNRIGLDITSLAGPGQTELQDAMAFLHRHPNVFRDLLTFAACGAVGQIFIFTVTVTRKMLTMILSVIMFGHRLTTWQWVGVGFVFGGVGAEGWIQKREKEQKEKKKKSS